MSYVYDIVLNFNNEYYDFYEWKKDDLIYHIKRINLIKVNSKLYNEILDNIVIFNDEFLLSIFNKCEYYNSRKIDSIPYAFILTDSYRAVALLLDSNGKTIKYSSLLLNEEEDILDLCYKLGDVNINYKLVRKREKNENLTRLEKNVIKYIKKDLKINYKKRDLNKLKYLYYEYFNKQSDDLYVIYQELINELDQNFNAKHYELYDLIKLSYSGKNV